MTEQEWLASNSIYEMFNFVEWKRKRRLFAVACCRGIWNDLSQESKSAVTVAEWFADGLAGRRSLRDAYNQVIYKVPHNDYSNYAACHAVSVDDDYLVYAAHFVSRAKGLNTTKEQCDLFRNIVNPFYKTTYNPSTQARNLADVIYKNKDWQALTVLADLLEEEGCTDTKLLNHLRTKEEVYRGWWSLDVVRGV